MAILNIPHGVGNIAWKFAIGSKFHYTGKKKKKDLKKTYIFWKMLTNALRAMVNNQFKESFMGKKNN